MGSKEQLAADSLAVKAISAAHETTKGKVVFVTSELGSDNAEALVDFFEVDPKTKNVQVQRRGRQMTCCTPVQRD